LCSRPIAFYRIHDKSFSYLNMDIAINELQAWYNEIQNHPVISKAKELNSVIKRIAYLKSLKIISDSDFFKGFVELIYFPLGINKIKLAIILFLPKFISKKIKTFGI